MLHIIDIIETRIKQTTKKDSKEKVEYLFKIFTKAIFYNHQRQKIDTNTK